MVHASAHLALDAALPHGFESRGVGHAILVFAPPFVLEAVLDFSLFALPPRFSPHCLHHLHLCSAVNQRKTRGTGEGKQREREPGEERGRDKAGGGGGRER